MTDRASLRPAVALALLATVVVAVLLIRPGGDGEPDRSTGAEATPTPTPPEPTIGAEEFCDSYATMATAYGQASGTTSDAAALEQLRTTSADFLTAGVGPGMGPLEVAGRARFVTDIQAAVGLVTAESGPAASEELAAFSRYLTATCPGY